MAVTFLLALIAAGMAIVCANLLVEAKGIGALAWLFLSLFYVFWVNVFMAYATGFGENCSKIWAFLSKAAGPWLATMHSKAQPVAVRICNRVVRITRFTRRGYAYISDWRVWNYLRLGRLRTPQPHL